MGLPLTMQRRTKKWIFAQFGRNFADGAAHLEGLENLRQKQVYIVEIPSHDIEYVMAQQGAIVSIEFNFSVELRAQSSSICATRIEKIGLCLTIHFLDSLLAAELGRATFKP